MKNVISTELAPAAIGPYSQAIEVNGMVYTSGIIPVVPATGEIPEGSAAHFLPEAAWRLQDFRRMSCLKSKRSRSKRHKQCRGKLWHRYRCQGFFVADSTERRLIV